MARRQRLIDPEGGPDARARQFNIFNDVFGMDDPFKGSPISAALSFGGGGNAQMTDAAQQQQMMMQQQQAQQAEQQQMMYLFAVVGALAVILIATKPSKKR